LLQDLRRGGRIETTYRSCFISFSSHDHAFAERLDYGLAASGIRTFLDENNLVPSMDLDTQFLRAVREHDHVITVLSDVSMASVWVAREPALSLEHGPEGHIPVRLCALEPARAWYLDTFVKNETQSRLILSFKNWTDALPRRWAHLPTTPAPAGPTMPPPRRVPRLRRPLPFPTTEAAPGLRHAAAGGARRHHRQRRQRRARGS